MEIDVNAILLQAQSIFYMTALGGLTVTAIVAVVKRFLKASGIATILISIVVSAGATLFVLVPAGFILWKFIVYTAVVALAANGIYLFPQKRAVKKS